MTFDDILQQYRESARDKREQGERFERLMQAYLLSEPQYAKVLSRVWLWAEFPYRQDFGGSDTGIDLVTLTQQGEYWAVQCKFFAPETTMDKPAVDSFLATSSRSFRDAEGQSHRFAHRLWISTSNRWGRQALEALSNQAPPVSRLNLADLREALVDWDKLAQGLQGQAVRLAKKQARPHQVEAIEACRHYFQSSERGKLVMACGTGKTYTALRVAETLCPPQGLVLFLVPSIALLGQTLREWSADAQNPIRPICICSDPKVSRKRQKQEDSELYSLVDLALPATTDPQRILAQFQTLAQEQGPGLRVVFSTYQSIEALAQAQQLWMAHGFPAFDLIVCDEAHRTTGIKLADEDDSAFVRVHDAQYIQARKRLYMTATPRLYTDESKAKAKENSAELCSMDDTKIYGEEIYRIGFGRAVEEGLLTDYKVLVLTLNDRDISPAIQRMISGEGAEVQSDDAAKIIGSINALSKQVIGDSAQSLSSDPEPMRRALAFCANIKVSQSLSKHYNEVSAAYTSDLPEAERQEVVSIEAKHIDGSMASTERDELLGWLKAPVADQQCRILCNVRCLSEGVDVPALDAVLFLSARNSQVDVVQSVGRVMRKAEGKKYGYIIIPVIVPSEVSPEAALSDNERYKVVWTVLNALRAHDDRFNALVNKIELNKRKPSQILVGGPAFTRHTEDEQGQGGSSGSGGGEGARMLRLQEGQAAVYQTGKSLQEQLFQDFEALQNAVFARLVQKVGDRRFWEQWVKDVAEIAERQIERLRNLIAEQPTQQQAFNRFLQGLRDSLNPSIGEEQAIEMLAQHLITKPVFDALFGDYAFASQNPVSQAMQAMLDRLQQQSLAEESETLQRFYDSVRKRAAGIDNAEGKQRIIIELYDKFFRTAFPKMAEQLGIVYTPPEVVDFIIHSVDALLQRAFNRRLAQPQVHILDPFTGTGTFLTRLIQSGLIPAEDLRRKYHDGELHANEIVLLAYYIAAINIEQAYHEQVGEQAGYEPFEGIVLTDTFQMNEKEAQNQFFEAELRHNSERAERQAQAPITVVMGNPPYSVGQKSANDNAQNQSYPKLDARIAATYARASEATNKNALYDSYIKAFRWSTDRLDPQNGGLIAFVSNGAWLDGNSTAGFRKVLAQEFSEIWVFNLRGNARTSGELRQQEAGNVFGSGSRTPIAITFLIKKPNSVGEAQIFYQDIGDYLSREEKLAKIRAWGSVLSPDMTWTKIQPNTEGDWLNQRDKSFEAFWAMASDKKFDSGSQSFFVVNSRGFETGRDAWIYNFSTDALVKNIHAMVEFYNQQMLELTQAKQQNKNLNAVDFLDMNPAKISWTSSLIAHAEKGRQVSYVPEKIKQAVYRPYCKQWAYTEEHLIHRKGQFNDFFPTPETKNLVICVPAPGGKKDFSVLMSDMIPDLHLNGDVQCFPLYYYEPSIEQGDLFGAGGQGVYVRREGISDWVWGRAKAQYGSALSREDLFYYVYGFLHSPSYRAKYSADLKKMLPRLPLLKRAADFWAFVEAGRQLAQWHVGYEQVPPCAEVRVVGAEAGFYQVEKLRFADRTDKSCIVYNSRIRLEGIPLRAYDYIVNGKSAIEWVMERYQPTVHKDSGLRNDPNAWAAEQGNPRYILDLLLSVIELSCRSVDLIAQLPEWEL